MARFDLGLSESEIVRISWFDLNKLFERHREKMRFQASINGCELQEPERFEPLSGAQTTQDRISYLDRWVKRTGGTNVKDGESPTTRS